ncbi:ATP-binding protein [Massilia sp. YMA4]|uniref:ATP-binding protein n=1 Tax=Massilia sp. YMA4 TaxID=1593482 RepID=UPI000DD12F5D|nr:HAMP domain-containing sensor histidine kinase [Massilia sp. YMA4]AXA93464.1 ATP-binding protein [Massilia sp. YMA4]
MTQVPFNVSARAAILIGRENIANSKGAIIELVKNAYDADSQFCIIYVDNKLATLNDKLSSREVDRMISRGIHPSYFKRLYRRSGQSLLLDSKAHPRYLEAFKRRIKRLAILYIIDVGDGMPQDIILNYWMTIGTDNKLYDYRTKSERVKSGAKGIGRFALDKLGAKCVMTTIPDIKRYSGAVFPGSVWTVDWRDFEGVRKTIDAVTANLETLENSNLILSTSSTEDEFDLARLWAQLKGLEYATKDNLPERKDFDDFYHGTVLKITDLHDDWNSELVTQVYEDLEILVPPKDIENFRIFLLSSLEPDRYGEILGPDCEDFDYKVEAKATADQEVEITVYREEYDFEKIPSEFCNLESTKKNIIAFPEKKWTKTFTFSELLSGFRDNESNLAKIGEFEFNFYFLKRTSTRKDTERFFYKEISDKKRKDWLKQFAGIKIYRDNFRVRPYGEIREAAFDWLGLGLRQASNPAGIAKETSGYKVRPENIAGAIRISRLTNLEFEDKSSRDGLQETKTFKVFKSLIISIIGKFEEDRASIAKELSAYAKTRAVEDIPVDPVTENLARQIIEREKEKRKKKQSRPLVATGGESTTSGPVGGTKSNNEKADNGNNDERSDELAILAQYAEGVAEENEKLLEEQKLLRGMASSGIVAASFGHDLSKTKDSLATRFDELTELLAPKVSPLDFSEFDEFDNPFEFIKEMQRDDRNILMWLGFSLGFARKDKRKRKQIYLDQFFKSIELNWRETLSERGIEILVDCPDDLKMRIFEIDFDSIFLNLLVNSIEAFKLSKIQGPRKIYIRCSDVDDRIRVNYSDTGPGLPQHLTDPNIIFQPMYTTKRDSVGQEVGTGLGMWIVKVISDEYQANVQLSAASPPTGFNISFSFPQKYKSKA